MAKKVIVGGRIESKEVGGIVTGAAEILDDTKGKKQSVINQETDAELERLGGAKQDVLTFDNTPTEGSDNPVKSGGLYTAQQAILLAIAAINELIPSAASALNKLADTAFVNSSISTNTATFRGTSAAGLTEQQFLAWANGLTHDLNDYVFWQTVDSAGNTLFKRYKWNGTEWAYEYTLNNSTFTAEQWEAIQSGITALLVTKLRALPTAQELIQSFDGKQDVLTFDNVPTLGSNNPVKSSGIYNVIKAITDLIPAEATAQNQLADKADVAAKIVAAIPSWKGQYDALTDLQAVTGAKAGDMGCVKTTDSDGHTVLTFYQYSAQGAWVVYYVLRHYAQSKPATTGTTGDYPYNGMGRIELQKNIVNGVNTLTQAMLTQQNTIYVIQYDFTLGEDITVPANCVLEFEGGSLSGAYTITGNLTLVCGNFHFTNILFSGTFTNKIVCIDDSFDGNIDFFGILRSFKKAKVVLKKDVAVSTKDTSAIGSVDIDGEGHTINVKTMVFSNNSAADANICNVVFDMANADPALLWNSNTEGGFLAFMGSNNNVNFTLKNCVFNNIDCNVTYLRGCNNVCIEDCVFNGVVDDVWDETGLAKGGIFVYGAQGSITILRNYIHDLHVGISCLVADNEDALIEDNVIEHMDAGCLTFAGGYINNCTVRGNRLFDANINNAHTTVPYNEVVNFHGAKNLVFDGNTIKSTYAGAIDIEGSDGSVIGGRGKNIIFTNNTILNGKHAAFSSLDGVIVKDNTFELSGGNIMIGCNNARFFNNNIKGSRFHITYSGADGIYIYENTIDNIPQLSFLEVNNTVTGDVVLGVNRLNGNTTYNDYTGNVVKFTDEVIETKIVKVPLGKVTRTPIFTYALPATNTFNWNSQLLEVAVFSMDGVHYSPNISLSIGRIRSSTGNYDDTALVASTSLSGHLQDLTVVIDKSLTANKVSPTNMYLVYVYCNGGNNDLLGTDMYMALTFNKYYKKYF